MVPNKERGSVVVKIAERVGHKLTDRDWKCVQAGRAWEREMIIEYLREHGDEYFDGWFNCNEIADDIEREVHSRGAVL